VSGRVVMLAAECLVNKGVSWQAGQNHRTVRSCDRITTTPLDTNNKNRARTTLLVYKPIVSNF
jgi:hypothetical protein